MNTNSVPPTEYQHSPDQILTDFEHIAVLQSLVNPRLYLHELCNELEEVTGK